MHERVTLAYFFSAISFRKSVPHHVYSHELKMFRATSLHFALGPIVLRFSLEPVHF